MRGAAIVIALVAGALAASCATPAHRTPPRTTHPGRRHERPAPARHPPARYRLAPAPAAVLDRCRRIQAIRTFPVLCPARLPRPVGRRAGRLFVWTYGPAATMYALVVVYGGPRERGVRQLNDPSRFLHAEVLGGLWSGAARPCDLCSSFNPRGRPGVRPLGRRVIAGHRGELYAGAPGRDELSGHLSFLWRARGTWHVVSLHAWRSRRETLAVLKALVASLTPAP